MLVNGLYLAVSTFTAKKRKEKVKKCYTKMVKRKSLYNIQYKKGNRKYIFLNEKRVYNKKVQ